MLAISGLAPLAELDGYSARLKSVTGGPGLVDDAVVALRAGAAQPAAAARDRIQEVAQAGGRLTDGRARTFVPAGGDDYNCVHGPSRIGNRMGESRVNLTHHFLIAMPSMADPHFAHTLTYVCEHNDNGALGIVDQQADRHDAVLAVRADRGAARRFRRLRDAPVHFGGPVQIDRGFVLHRPLGNWQSTLAISDDLGLTTSKDMLEAVGRGEGPQDVLVSLGYAGWSAGQLEQEIAQNAWLTVEADPDVLFDAAGRDAAAGGDAAARHRFFAAVRRRRARVSLAATLLRPAARAGTVLAFDFGTRRIGVAVGETTLGLAHPLATIAADSDDDRASRRSPR